VELSRYTRFHVGDGSKINFWHGMWCEDQSLKVALSELFNIARFKDASKADHLQLSNGSPQWNINFVRAVHD
jgi:hypothetical protein